MATWHDRRHYDDRVRLESAWVHRAKENPYRRHPHPAHRDHLTVLRKEVAGCSGHDETNPSKEGMDKLIEEKVIRKTLEEVVLKNRQPVLTLCGDRT